MRILRRGELVADLEAVICANTRTPEVTWGDINAQINTNSYGMTRFADLFGKYGTDKVLACWQEWMDICERELRKEIAKVPDGLYGPETDYLDDDGIDLEKSYRISATLEVKGDVLHFILDSDAQARGPINLRPCVSRNFIQCLVKMVFIPNLPVNDGLSRPVQVSYPPEGSLLNPRFPAPVNMYVRPSQVTTSVAIRALARAVPGRVPAPGSAAGGSISSAGRHPQSGRWYSQYEILSGGTGARPDSRRRQRHGRARRQRHEHAGRGGGKRISGARRDATSWRRIPAGPAPSAAASACAGNGAFSATNRSSICAPTVSSSLRREFSAPSPHMLRQHRCNPAPRRHGR